MGSPEAAWFAAALDGEGALVVSVARARPGRGFEYLVRPILVISNNNQAFVERAKQLAKCGIVSRSRKAGHGNCRVDHFSIAIRKYRDLRRVLTWCLPWLIIKRDKARAMIRFSDYYGSLIQEPLLDPERTTRLRGRTGPRLRLRNRGTISLCVWLRKNWFPFFQPEAHRSIEICAMAAKKRPVRIATIGYRGRHLHISKWAELTGLPIHTIRARLLAGWPAKKALSLRLTPTSKRSMFRKDRQRKEILG